MVVLLCPPSQEGKQNQWAKSQKWPWIQITYSLRSLSLPVSMDITLTSSVPAPCQCPEWGQGGCLKASSPSGSTATATTPAAVATHCSRSTVKIEEFHTYTEDGGHRGGEQLNCPCQGEAGKASQRWQHQVMPVSSHPSYHLPSLGGEGSLFCCFPDFLPDSMASFTLLVSTQFKE